MPINIVSEPSREGRERRASRRYGLLLPVIVKTATQQFCIARSKDVSMGGAYLVVEADDLLVGTDLDLILTLPKEVGGGAEMLVCAHGRTIRVDRFGGDWAGGIGIAVAFERYEFIRSTSPKR
jgi:hypothetical protein